MMQNSLVTQKDSAKIGGSLLLTKLSNILAGLIIFLSATQLGLHFWPVSSLVYGIRVDYLSPTLYFLDILIVLFLAARPVLTPGSDLLRKSWPSARMFSRAPQTSGETRSDPQELLGAFAPILLVNLLYSQNPLSTLSWSLHFMLYSLFLATLKVSTWLIPLSGIIAGLTLSLFFQTILALAQVILGHSVGGLTYYLGERTIAVGQPSIALGTFMGHVALRAYGTFSHPNILAGYAVISLLIIVVIRKQRPLFPLFLTTTLVLLSQSRSAATSLFGLIIPLYFLKTLKSRIVYFSIFAFVYLCIFPSALTPSRSELSSSQRHTLQDLSLLVIKNYPVFGTGASASVFAYPALSPNSRLLQPDHNSFTLFLSWFGLFGTIATFSILPKLDKLDGLYKFGTLLPLLLLDHYLLTSPQGLFILILYLGVAVNYHHAQKNL